MADNMKTLKVGLGLDPQSAAPSNPKDGDIYVDDGTTNDAGLYLHDGSFNRIGGVPESISTQSGNYTVLDSDGFTTILFDDTSSDRTCTLPTAADNTNRVLTIKNISTDKGKVTVDGEGAETIDGYTTVELDFKSCFMQIQSDGTEWHIINHNITSPVKRYAPVITGTGWTTSNGGNNTHATAYRSNIDSGGWRLSFNFQGTRTSSANFNVSMTGVSWSFNQSIYAIQTNSASIAHVFSSVEGTNSITLKLASAATNFQFSGDVSLDAKPTFVE